MWPAFLAGHECDRPVAGEVEKRQRKRIYEVGQYIGEVEMFGVRTEPSILTWPVPKDGPAAESV
jgi:hypothetical protein